MMKLPQERRIGPGHIMSEMDDDLPPLPGPAVQRKPLPFADEPLPKDRDERTRELKDRRRKEVEELTEEITEEKWSEMVKRVQGIEEKLDGMEASVKSAATAAPGTGAPSAELEDVKQDIEEQKRGIEDANARIDSLEEVVKGSLTPMVESIRKFSHAVKNAKGEAAPAVPPQQEPPEAAPQPVAAPPEVVAPTAVPEATAEPKPAAPAKKAE
jgi:DNA repair exonuclease SbcCD ATPase subunit